MVLEFIPYFTFFLSFVHRELMRQLNNRLHRPAPIPIPRAVTSSREKWMGEIRSQVRFKDTVIGGSCSVEQQLRLMKKVHATTVSTGQPRSQSLELLQTLGKWMGEIRSHLRFLHLVLSFLKFAVTVCSEFEAFVFPEHQ